MRYLSRLASVVIASTATLIALAGAGTAYAAPAAGSAPVAARGAPAASAAVSYVPAPCHAAPKHAVPGVEYARCFADVRATASHQVIADTSGPPAGALGPADIQSAYHLPAGRQGQTVAIADAFGDTHAAADLAVFRAHYGLPPCTTASGCLRIVDQTGGSQLPGEDEGWAIETSLDLDAVSSACPVCHILLVEANSPNIDDLGTAVGTAAALGATAVSNSYGVSGEFPGEAAYDHYYNHPGVAVTASAGDTGNLTIWPSTNPGVVSVGGTTLTRDSSVPRGWTETAWGGTGSGCSAYEPRPAYQRPVNTDCLMNRAVNDISADADPASGLAIYDTVSALGVGWMQVGGTSLASPLVAGMYALAGPRPAKDYPVTDLYDQVNDTHLNDITTGGNGTCGNVLCQARPGWDGPTGFGTPDGVAGLAATPHGDITGQVESGGKPLAGAVVATTNGYTATTDTTGHYDLWVTAGSYDVTGTMFGYAPASSTGVKVKADSSIRINFALRQVPSQMVSGVVSDRSGHGWPLYAKITVAGMPGAVYTSPYTGRYALTLPRGASYTLHAASAALPGYQDTDVHVQVADSDVQQNATLGVDVGTCLTPGYLAGHQGVLEQFTGWTGNTPQDGWTITDNNTSGSTWRFDNPDQLVPPPGGDAHFAYADSMTTSPNTDLISPVVDLSGVSKPVISFDTDYNQNLGSIAPNSQSGEVDLSLDGGITWTSVWRQVNTSVTGHIDVPIPQAAGQQNVRVKFHFIGTAHKGYWWMLDNVLIGAPTCTATSGGLMAGTITDANVRTPVDGATVTGATHGADMGSSSAMPGDPNLVHGFYWLVSSLPSQRFTVTDGRYVPASAAVAVPVNRVTRKDWALTAGRLTVGQSAVTLTQPLGGTSSATVTVRNTGSAPAHVSLGAQGGGFARQVAATGPDAPHHLIKGHYLPWAVPNAVVGAAAASRQLTLQATPQAGPWAPIADYPTTIFGNAVAYDSARGKLYSVAGYVNDKVGEVASGYSYDPSARTWYPIANLPRAMESPAAVVLDGTLYVIGGWDVRDGSLYDTFGTVYAYHPATNTWSQRADLPEQVGGARAVVLGGRIYVIGGSIDGISAFSSVFRYDPARNTWTQVADYPADMAAGACAAISGQIACAGGYTDGGSPTRVTYRYAPATNTWIEGADMPYDDWGMTYSGSGGKLQIAGGITDNNGDATNQAAQYNPVTNTWSALPNANNVAYNTAGGSGCGLYQIGNTTFNGGLVPGSASETLPGYDQCADAYTLPWLSVSPTGLDLAPGQSATVKLTVTSTSLTQPGTLTAALGVGTDTPYPMAPVTVTATVKPPASWGKLAGKVTDASTGKPIAGATVQICTTYDPNTGNCSTTSYTLHTDATGTYQLWLDQADDPLQLIAAMDGYQQEVRIVSLQAGRTTTLNLALKPVA